jgi:fused signal recognition particle receptor
VFDRFRKLDESVRRSRTAFFGRVADLFDRRQVDEDLWLDLEDLLLQADVGVSTTDALLEKVKQRVADERVKDTDGARKVLIDEMSAIFGSAARDMKLEKGRLNVVLIVGVNGSGKTTSIAKLARLLKQQGHEVVLAAADTFRAAAIDQLRIWGERIGVPVIAGQPDSDPGAVVFDAWQAAKARGADVLIVDTAGRLHTKFNLMEELKKMRRILAKQDPTAPHEVLLVLDATTGQNAIVQAREFTSAVGVTGLVLAKVDGTARGGSIFAIARDLRTPILYVGSGEKVDDLAEFEPNEFVQALLRETPR